MDERTSRMERRFELPVLVAALLVIPVIAIQESHPGELLWTIADVANWLIWLVFAAELVAMLAVSPDRWALLRARPLDVAIVVLTPPFLPAPMQAARVLRLLRLLRVFKAAKVVRNFFSLEGLRWAAIATTFVVVVGGAAFSAVEQKDDLTIWEGLYWSITTVTTIGGDINPEATGGRIIEIVVLLTGIGFIALLTGALAQQFVGTLDTKREESLGEVREAFASELSELAARLDRIERAVTRDG
jgi:voltage-gated potassium channel